MALSNNTKTMKKFFAAAAILFVTLSTQAQEVFVKVQYKENTVYKQTTKTANDIKIAAGEGEPMVQTQETNMISTTTTGKANADKTVPFKIKLDMGEEQAALLGNVSFIGKFQPGKGPVIESIDAPQMDEATKDAMKKMIDGIVKQAIMPDTKVKVGGSFKQEIPMEIPMGPMSLKLLSTTTYKLTKVEGNSAFFDTDLIITMNGSIEGQDVKASGAGKGKSIYDIKNNFMSKADAIVDMTMGMEVQGQKMDISVKTDTKQTVEITPVK